MVEPPLDERPGLLGRMALGFTDWSERWIPDAFVFALMATVIVFAGALGIGAEPLAVVDAWGKGFWELIPFTMQMALVIIAGYVLASAPPAYRLIARIARLPRSPRGAVAMVTLVAMLSSWLNWGFSLIFTAILAREVARRVRGVDYRALAASSFLGLGSVWAQGLSGSAALQMATEGALSPKIREIVAGGGAVPGGLIPFRHTIFLWQSLATVAIEMVVVTAAMWLAAPPPSRTRTAADLGVDLGALDATAQENGTDGALASGNGAVASKKRALTPGERLEHSPILTVLCVALAAVYIGRYFWSAKDRLSAINLNTLNLTFLFVGFALHGTPARMMRAVREATPAVWGVILQFPFYAGIAGVITYTHLSARIAHVFTSVSTRETYPAVIALYSAVLGVFVPSGGSKWIIEAPYVMESAHALQVHLGWMVAVYDLGEALANLVQPFWMLPILALLGLRARDVMGYTFVIFLLLLPLVLVMVTLFGMTLAYPL